MHPQEIYKTQAYQHLSGKEKYRIDSLPTKERLEALNNLVNNPDRYSQVNQGNKRFEGYSEADISDAFSKLPLAEQERINSLPPVMRVTALRALVRN
ncbi:MAG: hypothetical protein ACRCU2_07505 [Planktothrix sp.]